MITYKKVKKKSRVFKSIAGVTITEFEDLYQRFVPEWAKAEKKRLDRPERQRAIGGGHPYALEVERNVANDLGLATSVFVSGSIGVLL